MWCDAARCGLDRRSIRRAEDGPAPRPGSPSPLRDGVDEGPKHSGGRPKPGFLFREEGEGSPSRGRRSATPLRDRRPPPDPPKERSVQGGSQACRRHWQRRLPRATHGPASRELRRCCMRLPRPPPSPRYCRRPTPQTLVVRMTRPQDDRRHVRLFDGERTLIDQRRYPGTHRDRPRQNRNRAGSLAKGPGPIARRAGCCDVPACRPPRLGTEAMLTVDGSNLGTDIVRLGMT